MDGDEPDTSAKSWKERWGTLSERGAVLTKGVGSTLTDKGKRISNASKEAASKAKDSLEEARQRRLLERMAKAALVQPNQRFNSSLEKRQRTLQS